jgi:hypothetical protein
MLMIFKDKPEPTLAGMPREILGKIMGFALPAELLVTAYYGRVYHGIVAREVDAYGQVKALEWSDSGNEFRAWDPKGALLKPSVKSA